MSFITLRALLFVAECLLASVLLPLLAFAATCFLRRAALRHLTWLTMFAVLALLPLAALLLPARQFTMPVAISVSEPAIEIVATLPPVERTAAVAVLPEPWLTLENGLLLLAALWACGLAWNLGRMALGGFGLARLRRTSVAFRVPDAPCETRVSPEISGPATFGIFRPMIVLPQAAHAWSAGRLAAVLAHEAAHVRRHDIAGQSLARLVCAFSWFNPLLWLAARALRREAEFAADDMVLAGGMMPSTYAAELVALVSEIAEPPHRVQALGAGMADSPLLSRVRSVLAANISRKGVTTMDIARMLLLGLAATLLLGTARIDLALAQDKPRPAPAAEPAPAAKPAPAAQPAPSAAPRLNIEIERRIERDVEAVKADADAAAAQARARAEAEKDPAKRAQYAQEAARVAAQSAEARAQADQVMAEARQRMAQAEQHMKEAQQRMREAEPAMLEARTRMEEARRRMAEMDRAHIRSISSTISGVHLETQVVVPADVSKETQSRIDAAVSDAMGEARRKIEAAIAEAKAAPAQP